MLISRRVRRIRITLAVAGIAGVASLTAYVFRLKPAPAPPLPPPSVQTEGQGPDQDDAVDPASGEDISLGRILGTNNPAIPPITTPVGPPPGEDKAPDLSTPASAVHSVLSLIDQDETAKLAACFVETTAASATDTLYPLYLGQPIELVEVVEDAESALVIWNATVHTEFSLDGTSRSPGETIELRTQVVRAEDVWKLIKLHDGVENDPE